jgi:hypothetical protein
MKRDASREPGFYWVRFEGEPVVAEFILGHRSRHDFSHWHVPGYDACVNDQEVCEALSAKLLPPRTKP